MSSSFARMSAHACELGSVKQGAPAGDTATRRPLTLALSAAQSASEGQQGAFWTQKPLPVVGGTAVEGGSGTGVEGGPPPPPQVGSRPPTRLRKAPRGQDDTIERAVANPSAAAAIGLRGLQHEWCTRSETTSLSVSVT